MAILRFSYETTHFVKPPVLSEKQYASFKMKIERNKPINLSPNNETFTKYTANKFKEIGITLLIGLGLLGLSMLIHSSGAKVFAGVIGVISGGTLIASVFMFIGYFTSAPSYANYLKTKEKHYIWLQKIIKYSSSYSEFIAIYNSNQRI